VAIGTDIAHTSQHAAAQRDKLPSRGRRRTRFEALWPPGTRGGRFSDEASLAWTNWPLFTVGMVQRGHSDEVIRQILGGNTLRVCRENLRS
jgi:membrane dipeptidase